MQWRTRRLLIDALRREDAEALFRYRADPLASRYQGWHPTSVDEVLRFIEALETVAPDTPGTWYQRAIRLQGSGELVGDLGLHFMLDAEETVELGISLAPSHQGAGLAREALCEVLGFVFETLHKHRVTASVDPRNHACMKLLESVGMRNEAHFRESVRFGNEWADDVVFAMLEREWLVRGASECHHS